MRRLLIRFLQWCIRKLNGKYEISLNDFYKIIQEYSDNCGGLHFEVRVIKSPHDAPNSVRFQAYVAQHCYTQSKSSIAECIEELNASKGVKQEGEVSNVIF